jgi:Family of unknown function (DUF6343)
MPLGAQPNRADGSIEHPYSALRLRRVLAAFGVIMFAAVSGVLFALGLTPIAIACVVLAVVGLVDLWVIEVRLRRARQVRDGAGRPR